MASWVAPPLWVPGVTPGNASNLQKISDDLTTIGQVPDAWTPAVLTGWSSNFNIAGYMRQLDHWIDFAIRITFTGVPAGAGVVVCSLPSTPSASITNWSAFGTASVRDVSAGDSTTGTANYAGGSNVTAWFGSQRLSNAAPYTLATGDVVWLQGTYWED